MKDPRTGATAAPNRLAAQRILRLPDMCAKLGLSKATIYAKAAAGELPSQVRLGVRASGWVESEVDAWLEQRIALDRVHPKLEPAEASA